MGSGVDAERVRRNAILERVGDLSARIGHGLERWPVVDASVPEIDLEPVDLVDEDGDRLAGRTKLLAAVACEPGAPSAQDLDPLLVQPVAHQPTLIHADPAFPCLAAGSIRSLGHVSLPDTRSPPEAAPYVGATPAHSIHASL